MADRTPAAQTSEPQTEAGRALDSAGGWYDEVGTYVRCTDLTSAIRKIEAEAQRLTVDRLGVPPEAIEWARELVRQGYRDEHIVTFTEDGYGLEHPIRCRPNLTGCILNEWLRTQMGPDREPGRYVMEWHNNGPRYAALAREETRA